MSLQQEFRNAMSKLAAAVNIVTTGGEAGTVGITATAVCSVTDSPATVLVCVNRSSASNEIFKANGRMCVNTCASEHQEMSMHFAGMTGLEMRRAFCVRRVEPKSISSSSVKRSINDTGRAY